jgi:hypothetical protein
MACPPPTGGQLPVHPASGQAEVSSKWYVQLAA